MDFSGLPPELVEEIAAYLSVDDVIKCSMVNREWRQVFNNNDRIWKRFCTFHPQYFKKQVPKVDVGTENFFDGCESRKRLFKELQVEKNIVAGRVGIVKFNIGRLYCDNLLDIVDEIGTHWLILSCTDNQTYMSEHKFAVWDMSDEPTLHSITPTPLGVTRRILGSEMKLINNKVFHLSGSSVLVCEFRHPQYKLNILSHIQRPYLKDFTRHKEEQAPMACKADTVLAFCYSDIHHEQSLEPWVTVYNADGSIRHKNYSTAEVNKVEAELTASVISRSSVSLTICFDNSGGKNVFLVFSSFFFLRHAPQTMLVQLFSLKTFQYRTLLSKVVSKVICCKRDQEVFVVFYYVNDNGVFRETLTCYNTNGDEVYKTQLGIKTSRVCYEVLTAKMGKEVLVLKSSGDVTVIDVFQQKQLIQFTIPNLRHNFSGTVLNKNLIIVQHYRGHNLVNAIWDYQKGFQLYSLDELLAPYKSARPEPIARFSLNPNYLLPPKVFAIESPDSSLARNADSNILVLNWL